MLEVHNTVILVAETTPHAVSNLLRNVIKSANRTPPNRAEIKRGRQKLKLHMS